MPTVPADAWEEWGRRGAAQFRQPHNLFPRVRHILEADLPGMTDYLADAGCGWIDPIAALPPLIADRAPRPGDDRLRYIIGRGPVVEAVRACPWPAHWLDGEATTEVEVTARESSTAIAACASTAARWRPGS